MSQAKVNHPVANGCRRHGAVEIGCKFDEDMFEEIKRLALKNKTSFSEQLRTLVQWGLDTLDEWNEQA